MSTATQAILEHALAMADSGRAAEGVAVIEQLAAQGDPRALFTLGDLYWRGAAVPQDFVRGRQLFGRAARAGDPMAIRAYTNLLSSGIAGTRDWSTALARLRDEARSDTLRAKMLALVEAMALDDNGDPAQLPHAEPLSEQPEIALVRGAFSAPECDYLIASAEPGFEPSMVADGKGGDIRDPVRTSDGSTFHWLIEDPAIHAMNRRLAALTGTEAEQGEALQILRYRPGQQYRPHTDWLGDGGNRRLRTALIYLNDDYEGGETVFLKIGLEVKGKRGDVLAFRNGSVEGGLDPLTEHAGLPVTRGTKYLASRWIRAERRVA